MTTLFTEFTPVEIWAGTNLAGIAKICDIADVASLKFSEETLASTMQKTGTQKRVVVVSGVNCTAEVVAGEATIAQLESLTGQTADSGGTRLALKNRVGTDLRAAAQVVAFKPVEAGVVSTDDATWYVMPAAVIYPNFDIKFGLDQSGQKKFAVTIEGCPVTADEIASGGRIAGEGFELNDTLVLGD